MLSSIPSFLSFQVSKWKQIYNAIIVEDTYPVPVDIQRYKLPLGQPLIEAELLFTVEAVRHSGAKEAAVSHSHAHPVKQPHKELLSLSALTFPPSGLDTSGSGSCGVSTGWLASPSAGARHWSAAQRIHTPTVAL